MLLALAQIHVSVSVTYLSTSCNRRSGDGGLVFQTRPSSPYDLYDYERGPSFFVVANHGFWMISLGRPLLPSFRGGLILASRTIQSTTSWKHSSDSVSTSSATTATLTELTFTSRACSLLSFNGSPGCRDH